MANSRSKRRTSFLVILLCVGGFFCLVQWLNLQQSRYNFLDDARLILEQMAAAQNITLDGVFSVPKDENDTTSAPQTKGKDTQRPPPPSLADRRNIRVAFIGDSISRYMYLALAANLKDGEWYPDSKSPNLMMIRHFPGGWPDFYNFTNQYLRPYETCDCFRENGDLGPDNKFTENRFYMDPDRNNYVYYFQK